MFCSCCSLFPNSCWKGLGWMPPLFLLNIFGKTPCERATNHRCCCALTPIKTKKKPQRLLNLNVQGHSRCEICSAALWWFSSLTHCSHCCCYGEGRSDKHTQNSNICKALPTCAQMALKHLQGARPPFLYHLSAKFHSDSVSDNTPNSTVDARNAWKCIYHLKKSLKTIHLQSKFLCCIRNTQRRGPKST